MNEREYDLMLAQTAGELPPPPEEQAEPWSRAMRRIIWGLALVTFRIGVLYLEYILPCVGSVLVFLGFCSLRRSARGFALAYAASVILLVMEAVGTAASAARPGLFGGLGYLASTANIVLNFVLLLGMRSGIRSAFATTSGERLRDLVLWAVAAYAVFVAIALLEAVSPAQSLTGVYVRAIAAAALYIALLVLLARQGRALAGRGYSIEPAPVKLRAWAVFAIYALALTAMLVPAMLLGPRPEAADAAPLETADTAGARSELTELGMPEWLAGSLTESELALCEGATEVRGIVVDEGTMDTPDTERLELGVWVVYLADGRTRFYSAFRWLDPPRFRLQEALCLTPDGNNAVSDFVACLVYAEDGRELAAPLEVSLGGGLTADELDETGLCWHEHELDVLGHTQYEPYAAFSLPFGAEDIRGWLAFTYDAGAEREGTGTVFGNAIYYHQSLPRYPYEDISDTFYAMFGDKSWLRSAHYML